MKKILGLAVLCLLLAGVCAVLRRQETTLAIPGSDIRFAPAHSMTWDPATGVLRSTGDDPYGFLVIPDACIPLHEVTLEFAGAPAPSRSNFYLYQYPAYLAGVFINDSYALTGKPEVVGDGFRIRWRVADSKVARIDLPDDLDRPVELRRVLLVSGRYGSWLTTVMWLLLAAGLLVPAWLGVRGFLQRHVSAELALLALLVAAKLSFTADLRLTVIGNALHDEALFVDQADAIMHGHWLGDFNDRTLSKGPVFPLFLAAVGRSHLPLQFVQLAVHALACLLFLAAVRPLLPRVGPRLLLFAVLLFDPHTYSSETIGRVLRSGLHPALTLIFLAGLFGLGVRLARPPRALLGWSLLAGFGWLAFWFCREEGLWLVPSAILGGGAVAFAAFRLRDAHRGGRLAVLLLPFVIFAAGDGLLRYVNYRHYRAAMTVDVNDGAFPAAYGALVRLTPERELPTVPVPHETQLRAYAVSPAFAELRPYLEGELGATWVRLSREANGGDLAPTEIRGGWYQWALRDAAAQAGHYRDAATANAYWSRVAAEINGAVAAGRIAGGPKRSGFLPRLHASDLPALRHSFADAAKVVVQFAHFTTQFLGVNNPPDRLAVFARVTNEGQSMQWAPPTRLTDVRITLSKIYGWFSVPASIAACAGLIVLAVRAARTRRGAFPLVIALALAGGAVALMLVVSLVDATSFTAVIGTYLAPATPLVLAAWILAPAWALAAPPEETADTPRRD